MTEEKKLKERAVGSIVEELKGVDANDFERIGHSLVEAIIDKSLSHRGLGIKGRPAGYTVDTFSSDYNIIAQYSVDESYFEKPFTKLADDIAHARKKNANCEALYLLAAQVCQNIYTNDVGKKVNSLKFGRCRIEWYDGRRIAETIFDVIVRSNNLVDKFTNLLPSVGRVFEEYVFDKTAPRAPGDLVTDAGRQSVVERAISERNVVAIWGISGAGKTYDAIAFCAKHAQSYGNVIWIAGEDLAGATDLRAVHIKRLGTQRNLAYSLTSTNCLLVIDNFETGGPDLHSLLPSDMHPGSRVLVTTLSRMPESVLSVELPPLSQANAEKILRAGLGTQPSAEEVGKAIELSGGIPLVLAILRDTVQETGISWAALISDIESNLPAYAGRDNEPILHRILGRHAPEIGEQLLVLKWLDMPLLDARFAEAILKPYGIAKLYRRSILKHSGFGQVKVHDLVMRCIKVFEAPGVANDPKKGFWDYFESTWEKSPYHFHRALHTHSKRVLEELDLNNPAPGLRAYLALLIENHPVTKQGIRSLAEQDIIPLLDSRPSVSSVIEAIEQDIRHLERNSSHDEPLTNAVGRLTAALERTRAGSATWCDLLHQRGKFYHWLNRLPEATADFESVLASAPENRATQLQLARIRAKRKLERPSEPLAAIIEAFENDFYSVPSTVLLATFSELSRQAHKDLRNEILEGHMPLFERAVTLSIVDGFSQPYRMLGRLGRHIFYAHPTTLINLVTEVSFPPAASAEPEELFEIAECMKFVGKAEDEERRNSDAAQRWFRRALPYYERIAEPNVFNLIMYAECLIRVGIFQHAEDVLSRVTDPDRTAHWWHRQSQALLGRGFKEEAKSAIDRCLSFPGNTDYRGAFLQAKARVQDSLGDSACLATLQQAVDLTSHPKFKLELRTELEECRQRHS